MWFIKAVEIQEMTTSRQISSNLGTTDYANVFLGKFIQDLTVLNVVTSFYILYKSMIEIPFADYVQGPVGGDTGTVMMVE